MKKIDPKTFKKMSQEPMPIVVTDKNDKRLKAYSDSSALYNSTKNDPALLKSKGMNLQKWTDHTKNWEKKNPGAIKAFHDLKEKNGVYPQPKITTGEFLFKDGQKAKAAVYDKPKQPVVLRQMSGQKPVSKMQQTKEFVPFKKPADKIRPVPQEVKAEPAPVAKAEPTKPTAVVNPTPSNGKARLYPSGEVSDKDLDDLRSMKNTSVDKIVNRPVVEGGGRVYGPDDSDAIKKLIMMRKKKQ